MCLSEMSKTFPNTFCTHKSWCVEYISTYIVHCKYDSDYTAFLPVILYFSAITSAFILHLVATLLFKSRVDYLLHVCLVLQTVGFSFVIVYDNVNLTGEYIDNDKIRNFRGYTIDNNFLHALGVAFFCISSLITFVTFWWKCKKKVFGIFFENFLLTLEGLEEIVYFIFISIFFVMFTCNVVAPAIFFEYLVMFSYAVLFVTSVVLFLKLSHVQTDVCDM